MVRGPPSARHDKLFNNKPMLSSSALSWVQPFVGASPQEARAGALCGGGRRAEVEGWWWRCHHVTVAAVRVKRGECNGAAQHLCAASHESAYAHSPMLFYDIISPVCSMLCLPHFGLHPVLLRFYGLQGGLSIWGVSVLDPRAL